MAEEQNCGCDCCCENIATQTVNVPVTLGICVKDIGSSGCGKDACGCVSYSFEEQWTGKYWVDGKKIYQKTIDCGMGPASATIKDTPHDIENIETFVHAYGVGVSGQSVIPMPYPAYSTKCVALAAYGDRVSIQAYGDTFTQHRFFITLQYTCSDR